MLLFLQYVWLRMCRCVLLTTIGYLWQWRILKAYPFCGKQLLDLYCFSSCYGLDVQSLFQIVVAGELTQSESHSFVLIWPVAPGSNPIAIATAALHCSVPECCTPEMIRSLSQSFILIWPRAPCFKPFDTAARSIALSQKVVAAEMAQNLSHSFIHSDLAQGSLF